MSCKEGPVVTGKHVCHRRTSFQRNGPGCLGDLDLAGIQCTIFEGHNVTSLKICFPGCLGGSVVDDLPLAQGVILGSRVESHSELPVGTCFSLCLCLCFSLYLS